jgi:hypothetical protein
MTFTQWVVEWAIDNGANVPKVWGPVMARRRTRRPLMCDSKSDAESEAAFRRTYNNGIRYRVRKVTFGEIGCD